MANFQPARAKLTIGSLDDTDLTVKAHYNPKELQVTKQIPWTAHDERDRQVMAGTKPGGDQDSVELTGAPSRSMSVELLFDGYESNTSVAAAVAVLDQLSSPKDTSGPAEDERRPHYCVVVWGDRGIPPFRCVIEQLVVKYTMFDSDGVPLRAVCTVNLKEADLRLKAEVETRQAVVLARSRSAPTAPAAPPARATVRPVSPPRTPPVLGPSLPPTAAKPSPNAPQAPKPPSAAGRREAMDLFREANGDAPRPIGQAPRPPSAAGQAEAMDLFREANGDAPARPVDPDILGDLE